MNAVALRRSTSALAGRPRSVWNGKFLRKSRIPGEVQRTKLPVTVRLSWAGIELDYIDRGHHRGLPPYGRLQRINTNESNRSSRRTNSHVRARSRVVGVGARTCTRLTMSGGILKRLPTLFQQNSRQHAKLGILNRPQAISAEDPLPLWGGILQDEFVGRPPIRDLPTAAYQTVKATLIVVIRQKPARLMRPKPAAEIVCGR
jgi:hypothetical protein